MPTSQGVLVGTKKLEHSPWTRTQLSIQLTYNGVKERPIALLDSGTEGNFLDVSLTVLWGIPAVPLSRALTVWLHDGRQMVRFTHCTPTTSLSVSGNHCVENVLYLLQSPLAPIALGHARLAQHNPHVDWHSNNILDWSQSCVLSWFCLRWFCVFCVTDAVG